MQHEHIYTSAKGEDFLSMDQWLRVKFTPEEYENYKDVDYQDIVHQQNYAEWIVAEQIIRHKYIEDGVEVFDIEVRPN
jgi:hypothetical protein